MVKGIDCSDARSYGEITARSPRPRHPDRWRTAVERLARLVVRHRRTVFGFWLVMFLAGGFAAGKVPDRLGIDFSLPGQPGDTAEKHLVEAYGTSSYDTFVAVVTVPEGQTVEASKDQVAKVFTDASAVFPKARLVDLVSTGDPAFVTDDHRTTYALLQGAQPTSFAPGPEAGLAAALQKAAQGSGFTTGVTSYGLLSAGNGSNEGPSVLAETLFGALGALV